MSRELALWFAKDNTGQITCIRIADWEETKDLHRRADDKHRPALVEFPVTGIADYDTQRRRAEAMLAYLEKEKNLLPALSALEL